MGYIRAFLRVFYNLFYFSLGKNEHFYALTAFLYLFPFLCSSTIVVLCTSGPATPFHVAFSPLDVASRRQVLSANLNLVALIGLDRAL